MKIQLKILPADIGDSILIKYKGSDNQFHNLLIDGGLARTYKTCLHSEFVQLKENKEVVDLMIITHIDSDHIGGILAALRDDKNHDLIQKFWFNSGKLITEIPPQKNIYEELFLKSSDNKISIRQGITLEKFLEGNGRWHSAPIQRIQEYHLFGAKITILSPSDDSLKKICYQWEKAERKINSEVSDYSLSIDELANKKFQEDTSITNGSSIAFLLTIHNVNILLLSDSKPSIIIDSLKRLGYTSSNKLKVDYLKISHHGSKANTNYDLLDLIQCENYIVSTNGRSNNFPHKTTFARILCNPTRPKNNKIHFIFNYNNPVFTNIFSELDSSIYNFDCLFPQGESGYKIRIL